MRIVLFERKKNTQGVRFLTKYQTNAWKMATVWHLRDKLQQSPVVVTETHRDTGRGDYVTYRFLCNVTENGRFEPFFSSIFFLFPECVILEIGISTGVFRWLADCVGVYFLLIFFFQSYHAPQYMVFERKEKTLTECFICAWAFKMANLKILDIYTYMNMYL